MSTFEGRMKEYRLVSIDRFDGENLSSTVYFLSHIHTDHTVGLDQGAFFDKLKQRGNTYVYCSEITRILLLGNSRKYGHLAPYVKSLETLCPSTIDIPAACPEDQNSTVLVTLLPAAHCLGSVMFLFEGDEGNVLYTGDFRWGMSEATQMQYLDPRSKPLRSIYVDTTFCCPKAFYIPSRKQCEDGVISLVKSHFHEYGPNGHIWIESRTNFGHETLLREISLHVNMKIHVAAWKKDLYDQIPSLKDIFTENPEETRIHAHPRNTYRRFSTTSLPCGYVPLVEKMNLIQIRPSTMWFTTLPEILNIVQQDKFGMYRACYSFHSSYSEIRDLIQYLKPARVFPNVIPTSKTFDEIQNILNSFLSTPHYKHFSSVESEEQPLGIMKIPSNLSKESLSVEDCAFDDTPNMSGNSQGKNSLSNSQSGNSLERTSLPNSQSENGHEEISIQNSQSSYDGSRKSDSELDLYSSVDSQMNDQPIDNLLPLSASIQSSSSLPTYIEDNSDDSEDDEEVSQNEYLKSPIGVNSSKSEEETEKSTETPLKVPEEKDRERKMNELSGPANSLRSGAGDNKQEHKKEEDLSEAANISKVRESSKEQGDKTEENSKKEFCDSIYLEEDFGTGNNKQEHKKKQDLLEDADISKVRDNSKEQGDKTEEDCIKKSKDRINFEKDFGALNNKQEHKKKQDLLEEADISKVRDNSKEQEDKTEEDCIKKSKNRINFEKDFGALNNKQEHKKKQNLFEAANISKVRDSSKEKGDKTEEDCMIKFNGNINLEEDFGAVNNKQEDKKADLFEAANISKVRDSSNEQGDKTEEYCIKKSRDRNSLEGVLGNDKQELKKEKNLLEAADISNVSDSSNEERDETGGNCKKSNDRINLEEIFGSQNSFFAQLNNSGSCYRIHRDENASASISSKNLGETSSASDPDRPRLTGVGKMNVTSSHEIFSDIIVNSMEMWEEAFGIDERIKGRGPEKENLVTDRNENSSCSFNLKRPGFEKILSSTPSEKHGGNDEEWCSQKKYRKMNPSLKAVNSQLNGSPSEEFDCVEIVSDKKELLESEIKNIFQKANCNRENPVRSPKRLTASTTSEIQEANQSSFNTKTKNPQNMNSKDRIPQAEDFGNRVPSVDSCLNPTNIGSKMHNDPREMNSSQESKKTDTSIEIIKVIPKNPTVIEISDSEDDCIAIDSDSDETLPPSPGAMESSQELFSSFDALNDKSNVCDSSDEDVVVI